MMSTRGGKRKGKGSTVLAAPGATLRGRYKVDRLIGAGNYGSCWLVRDAESRDEPRVVKQVHSSEAVSEEDLSKAHKEAKLLSELKHPHIVRFYDQFVDVNCVNIVTEYCDGGDLSEAIEWQKAPEKGGGAPFGESVVLNWLVQITTALNYMHERRILHRDVKTKNVFLIKSKGRRIVKLGDFGIAKTIGGSMDMTKSVAGTPFYMSPECLKGVGYNEKSDMWALGCVLYELCLLQHPFSGQSLMGLMYNICEGEVKFDLPDCYSAEMTTLITVLFNRDQKARPTTSQLLISPLVAAHIKEVAKRVAVVEVGKAAASPTKATKSSRRSSGSVSSATSPGPASPTTLEKNADPELAGALAYFLSDATAVATTESAKERKLRLKAERAAMKKASKEAKEAEKTLRKQQRKARKDSRRSGSSDSSFESAKRSADGFVEYAPTADGPAESGTVVFSPRGSANSAGSEDFEGTFRAGATSGDSDQQYKLGVHLLKLAGESGGEDGTVTLQANAEISALDSKSLSHTLSEGSLVREEDQNSLFGDSDEDQMDDDDQRELMRAVQAAIDVPGGWAVSEDTGAGGADVLLDGDGAVVAEGYHTMLVHDSASFFDAQVKNLRASAMHVLGPDFDTIYTYLLNARSQQMSDQAITAYLTHNYGVDKLQACFHCDYLVCLECFGQVDIVMYE